MSTADKPSNEPTSYLAPRVFVSYSHDDESHKDWVLRLATRLMSNGVDVILDQWNVGLGSDLPRFMESGLTSADRVLAICTDAYVERANEGTGGTGYEKMILSAKILRDSRKEFVIPVIRANTKTEKVPTFLSGRVYVDFSDDLLYETRYGELIADIHGHKIKPRPQLGKNPFIGVQSPIAPLISFGPERYVSPASRGTISFDYSNNNGRYVVGAGDTAFETQWSSGSVDAIHVYSDPPSIRSVAIATGARSFDEIIDASMFDTSSRARSPMLGEIVVWQNTAGYYLATRIENIKCRGPGGTVDEVTFSYLIAPRKSPSFESIKAIAISLEALWNEGDRLSKDSAAGSEAWALTAREWETRVEARLKAYDDGERMMFATLDDGVRTPATAGTHAYGEQMKARHRAKLSKLRLIAARAYERSKSRYFAQD